MAGLLLSRREGQEIVIGGAGVVLTGPVVVRIEDVRGRVARVRILAPDEISIRRSELPERTQQEAIENGRS